MQRCRCNPSSAHAYGRRAAQAVATARRQVADLIGAKPHEIVFTGCATESNNLALLGTARSVIENGSAKRHIVISAVEHPAVMAPAMQLRAQGWHVTVLPVDALGRVSAEQVANALRDDTALVSIMHTNNEVGTLQPIPEIAAVTSQRGILLHTDGPSLRQSTAQCRCLGCGFADAGGSQALCAQKHWRLVRPRGYTDSCCAARRGSGTRFATWHRECGCDCGARGRCGTGQRLAGNHGGTSCLSRRLWVRNGAKRDPERNGRSRSDIKSANESNGNAVQIGRRLSRYGAFSGCFAVHLT